MVYAYNLIMFFGLGVLLSFMSVFFTTETSLTASQVTMMMSFAPIISFFSTNFFAFISDKTRQHKKVLMTAMVLAIITSITLATVAQYEVVALVILSYVVFSFFMSSPGALSDNFVMQYSNIKNIPYGRIRLFGSLGYAIAGQVAGYLTDSFGLTIIFWVYALCIFIPLIFVPKFPDIEDVDDHEEEVTVESKGIYKNLVQNKPYVATIIVSFFILGSVQATGTFFGLYITQHANLSLTFLGTTILISAGTEIPMMFFSDKLIEKFGAYKILAVSATLNTIRFLAYFFFPVKWVIIAVTLTHGIGYGSAFTSVMHLIGENVSAKVRASAISINTTVAIGLGSFAITFLGSIFLDARSIYVALAVFEFIGLLLCLYLILRHKEFKQ